MLVSDFDDGGSFESLVREAEEAANGNGALALKLLEERIVGEFVNKQIERASLFIRKQEEPVIPKKHCVLGVYVPTKRRSEPCSKLQFPAAVTTLNAPPKLLSPTIKILDLPPKAENKKSSQKRQFDEIQTQNSNKKEKQTIRQQDNQRKKRKTDKPIRVNVPDMPESFRNKIEEMRGKDVKLVIQRGITTSDLSGRQNRLSIARKQILNTFLTEEEKQTLHGNKGIEDVSLIQPCLELTKVKLKRWTMGKTYSYTLISTWYKEVVMNEANGLEIGSTVQLYSFRLQDKKLCFAPVKLD